MAYSQHHIFFLFQLLSGMLSEEFINHNYEGKNIWLMKAFYDHYKEDVKLNQTFRLLDYFNKESLNEFLGNSDKGESEIANTHPQEPLKVESDIKDISPRGLLETEMNNQEISPRELLEYETNIKDITPKGLLETDIKEISPRGLLYTEFDVKEIRPRGLFDTEIDTKENSPTGLFDTEIDVKEHSPTGSVETDIKEISPRGLFDTEIDVKEHSPAENYSELNNSSELPNTTDLEERGFTVSKDSKLSLRNKFLPSRKVEVHVFRGSNIKYTDIHGHSKYFAPWGYFVTQPNNSGYKSKHYGYNSNELH